MGKAKNTEPTLIGLTGGIGSGKSKVAEIIQSYGIPVINADQLSRELTVPGSKALSEIKENFGDDYIEEGGSLNRSKLRKKITADPSSRKLLESILHPKIHQLGRLKIEEYTHQGKDFIFYEAPLLIEAGNYKDFKNIVCVVAPDKIRIQRTMARDKISEDEAKKILLSQMPQDEKIKFCSHIIENNGSIEELRKKVTVCLQDLYPAFHTFK